jgi:hypothetical protein
VTSTIQINHILIVILKHSQGPSVRRDGAWRSELA